MRRGQLFSADALLSLTLASLAIVFLTATAATPESQAGNLKLERAGYDFTNAFYSDVAPTLERGLEARNYLSTSELNYARTHLYSYGKALDLKHATLEIIGGQTIEAPISELPKTRKETFYLTLSYNGGKTNKLARLELWD